MDGDGLLEKCKDVVGPTRAAWLASFVKRVIPGSRLLLLGHRRAGKSTLLRRLLELVTGTPETHMVEAYSASASEDLERATVFCLAPRHDRHRIVLIDDVECFAGSDVTAVRRLIRSHADISFVLTTSTVAGLQESLVAQCNVVELMMPRIADLQRLGGDNCTPSPGMSVSAARNQRKACELIGRPLRWQERCEAPAIIAAVGQPELCEPALAEVQKLLQDGWSCGDLIETLHMALVRGEWAGGRALDIAKVLLRHSVHCDRPDVHSAMTYLMVLELIAVATIATAEEPS
jgi:energy-coupling factor transporter ATP-binding protein EcfA2